MALESAEGNDRAANVSARKAELIESMIDGNPSDRRREEITRALKRSYVEMIDLVADARWYETREAADFLQLAQRRNPSIALVLESRSLDRLATQLLEKVSLVFVHVVSFLGLMSLAF